MALSNRINFRGGQNVDRDKLYLFKNGSSEPITNPVSYDPTMINDGGWTIGSTMSASVSIANHYRALMTTATFNLTDYVNVCVKLSDGTVKKLGIANHTTAHIGIARYNNANNYARFAILTNANNSNIAQNATNIGYFDCDSTLTIKEWWIEKQ